MSIRTRPAKVAIDISEPILRCAVVGVGRMGRHHARVYNETAGVTLVGVVDHNEDRRETMVETHGCAPFETIDDLLKEGVDAVTIAVPTTHHLETARPFLERGIACLVEKPLAHDSQQAQELVELADRHGAVLQVGHSERFNPVVQALKREQERDAEANAGAGIVPRFIEVNRISPMTFRSVDVSVVFDMMIHDLDLVMMLMDGVEPTNVQASGVPVITEYADICNARLTFERPAGVCIANITASRLALKTERKMRLIARDAYVSLDYAKKSGVVIRRAPNTLILDEVRSALRDGKDLSDLDYGNLVSVQDLRIDDQEPLKLQLASFLDAIRNGERPEVDARAGLAAVRTAERIIESMRESW